MKNWPHWLPVAVLVVFGFFVYAPLLFFGQAFYGEEQMGFYYSMSHYVSESLHSGTSLMWNSAHYGGVSASLDQFVSAFYPLNLMLFSLFGFFFAHHLSITLATIAGLLFSYWFGQLQGWRRSSSVILALCYFLATTYGWLQIGTLTAHSFAILPALLVAVQYARTRHWYWAVLGGGVALGVGFLAGFVQIVFYEYVIAGAYALYLDWSLYRRDDVWCCLLGTSLAFAGMSVVGLLVGLKQFLPSAALISLTIRSATYAGQNITPPNPLELIAYILPPYQNIPFFGGGSAAGFYVGATGFVFVILALMYYRARTTVFFALLYTAIMGFAFNLPLFGWLNAHVPPFSHMGGNFRWSVAAAFPLAYVAAAGVEGFVRHPEYLLHTTRRWIVRSIGALVALLVLGSVVLTLVVRYVASSSSLLESLVGWYTNHRVLVHPLEHYTSILTQALQSFADMFSLTNPRYLFAVLLWLLTLAFFVWYDRVWLRAYRAHVIVTLFLITAMGTAALQWADLVPQSLYATEPRLAQLIKAREKDPTSYRVMGYVIGDGMFAQLAGTPPLSPTQNTKLQLDTLSNNSNQFWGIQRMDGMEPYRTLRANRLLNTVVAHDWGTYVFDDTSPAIATSPLDQLYNRDVQKQVPIGEKLQDIGKRMPLLSMMNVAYVYAPYELSAPGLSFMNMVKLAPSPSADVALYLYHNENVLPRVYFAQSELFATSERDALMKGITTPDFAKQTIIECVNCAVRAGKQSVLSVVKYENGRVAIDTDTSSMQWLVLSESMLPGWKAYIDGAEVPLYYANYLFRAVEVPAGKHRVTFEYRDRFGVLDLFKAL